MACYSTVKGVLKIQPILIIFLLPKFAVIRHHTAGVENTV
jgi:hypothetical protein